MTGFMEYGQRFWGLRREFLGNAGRPFDRALEGCGDGEKIWYRYVLATLPLSDLGDYGPELLLKIVREALEVRRDFSWCRELPEEIFLLHVLYPRINNEALSDCRSLFRDALIRRVSGLSLEEAVLEVNRWCGENVTYRSTDDVTSSALDIFRRGFGRCGEESVFAVTTLRSVGIAARQVYAPWWSHCDDNHAWVEVYVGGRWRYLGACEPEPVLDRGWFTAAASRAMMIHARAFVQGDRADWGFLFPGCDPADLGEENGVVFEAVTERYGALRMVTVTVRDRQGRPVSNALVHFEVLNMAAFREIAVRRTDQDGNAVARLGLGSVRIRAAGYGEALLDVSEKDHAELQEESNGTRRELPGEFNFSAPAGAAGYPEPLPPALQESRRNMLERCAALRQEKEDSRQAVVNPAYSELKSRAAATLTEKDRASELPEGILEDALGAFAFEDRYPREVFEEALLCPRIGQEPLAPWRRELTGSFSQEERETFFRQPEALWRWTEEHIRPAHGPSTLCGTPVGIFRLRAANEPGRRLFFCALCRALGIPARLSPLDRTPEYWQDGAYRRLEKAASAALILTAPANRPGVAGQSFSLCRRESGEPLAMESVPAGESRQIAVSPGSYELLTVTRLPGGDQLAVRRELPAASGENGRAALEFREGGLADMLGCLALPPFQLEDESGAQKKSANIFREKAHSLLFWLEPGREPTEHILNELRESAGALTAAACSLHLIVECREQSGDPTLQLALSALPGAKLWYGDFQDTAPALARRVFADPDRLPLILLTDDRGNSLYSTCGYNVGTGELLIRLLEELADK